MNDDDFDSELFEGRVEITRTENGASFSLSPETYLRMATMSMDAAGMRIEPSMICRLTSGERGCRLVLFGRTHQFDVVVRVFRSSTTLAVTCQPLDGLHCMIPLYEGQDNDCHWRALRSMLAVEGTHYVDQH